MYGVNGLVRNFVIQILRVRRREMTGRWRDGVKGKEKDRKM